MQCRSLLALAGIECHEGRVGVRIDPRVAYGRPFIGEAIRTEVVSTRFGAGETITELAEDYGCSQQQIEEAVRYHHKEAA